MRRTWRLEQARRDADRLWDTRQEPHARVVRDGSGVVDRLRGSLIAAPGPVRWAVPATNTATPDARVSGAGRGRRVADAGRAPRPGDELAPGSRPEQARPL